MTQKTWTEPKSAANETQKPLYPYNNATVTDSGHSFELDDTPERERVRLFHRKGSFIEFHPNGDQVVKVVGKNYQITADDNNVSIGGDCNITVDGDYSLWVKGNYNLRVDGDMTKKLSGNHQTLNSDSSKSDNRMTEGDLTLGASGNLILNADKVIINSDLTVGGNIGGNQSITAVQNITAQMSVIGIISVRTPGALLVGPMASAMPNIPLPGIGQFDTGLNVAFPVKPGFVNLFGALSVVGAQTTKGLNHTIGNVTCIGGEIISTTTPLHLHVHGGVFPGPSMTSPPMP